MSERKPKIFKDGRNFSISLDKGQLEHVKRMAREMSREQMRDICTSEAIRYAIDQTFPRFTQADMFDKINKKRKLRKEYEEKFQMKFAELKL